MAYKGNKVRINLNRPLCTDEANPLIHSFQDTSTNHQTNTGLVRRGGIIPLSVTADTLGPFTGNTFFVADNGSVIQSSISGNNNSIYLNGNLLGTISSFGIARTTIQGTPNDVFITADSNYVTLVLNKNSLIITEYSLENVQLATRTIIFSQLPITLPQIATSLSFVRYLGMKYSDSLEFFLRIGTQLVLLQESNISVSFASSGIQSTNAINTQGLTGWSVYCSAVWTIPQNPLPMVVFGGDSGRLASYDGARWHAFDLSQGGVGPAINGTLTNKQRIISMAVCTLPGVFNNYLVVGSKIGYIGAISPNLTSFPYNSSGIGPWSNQAAVSTQDVTSITNYGNFLIFTGGGGGVSSFDGIYWYPYNAGSGLTNNNLVLNAKKIECSTVFNNGVLNSVVVAGDSGLLGSASPSIGITTPTTVTIAAVGGVGDQAAIASNGSGIVMVAHGSAASNPVVYVSTNWGITWASVATISSTSFEGLIYVKNGIWLLYTGTSGTNLWQSTNNGATWTNTSISNISINDISWDGNNTLLAVGNHTANPAAYSFGAITGTSIAWSAAASISNWANSTVAYGSCYISGNSTWAVVGADHSTPTNAYYSLYSAGAWNNGATITNWASLGSSQGVAYDCLYANGYLVVVGKGNGTGSIAYSSNYGSSFTIVNPASYLSGITYSAKFGWVASGIIVATSYAAYLTSSNVSSWSTGNAMNSAASSASNVSQNITSDSYYLYQTIVPQTGNFSFAISTQSATWLNHNNATGSNLANNSTVLSSKNIYSIIQYGSGATAKLVVAGGSGLVGSFSDTTGGAAWRNYNASTGLCNNGTIIAADTIYTMSADSTILIFGGVSGNLGSWDGSAFRGWGDTGTGNGPTSWANGKTAQLIGGDNIYTSTYYNPTGNSDVLMVGGLNGAINSINPNNTFSSFYTLNGSSLQSQILFGFADYSYLYAYRYENGHYLINIVGNIENESLTYNNTARSLISNKARYAFPQVSNGKSRHILTMDGNGNPSSVVAIADSSGSYAQSLVGYTDFINYADTAIYPSTGIKTTHLGYFVEPLKNSIGTVVGNYAISNWGYAEFNYYQVTASQNIWNFYSPVYSPTTTSSWTTNQANTNTLINGYGKLTNAYGVTPLYPFEIRVNIINGAAQYLSVAQISGSTDNLGVMLTNYGELDTSYTPHVVGDNKILWRYNGNFYIAKITNSNIPNLIQKVGEDIYNINSISPNCLIDVNNSLLNVDHADYHGQVLFNSTLAADSVQHFFDGLFQGPYSNSPDPGNKFHGISNLSSSNISIFGYTIPTSLIQRYAIDCYSDNLYMVSAENDGSSKLINQGLQVSTTTTSGPIVTGQAYSTAIVLNSSGGTTPVIPVAQGYVYGNKTVTTPVETIFLLQNYNTGLINGLALVYDGYGIGNQIPGIYSNFLVQGQTYLYDGEYIWLANFNNNVLQNKNKVAEAYDLKFISQSPIIAYFISTFDNSLFAYTQNYQLQPILQLNELGQITSGVFGDGENTLLMLNSTSLIWMRNGIITENVLLPQQQNLQLFNTTNGIIILGNDGNNWYTWQYSFGQPAGSTIVPLDWESGVFGQQGSRKSIVNSILVNLHNPAKTKTSVNAIIRTINTGNTGNWNEYVQPVISMTINPSDWSLNGQRVIRFQPDENAQRSLGISIELKCNSYVIIKSVEFEVGDDTISIPEVGFTR